MTDLTDLARDALKQVYDPEAGINIVDMGLVYDIATQGSDLHVTMTFTTEGCPAGPFLVDQVEHALLNIDGVTGATISITFDPPWTPEMISADGREVLQL